MEEAQFHIEKVIKINGYGCRYELSCDIDDPGDLTNRSGDGYAEERKLYIGKGYIFSDERQCRVYHKELKFLKRLAERDRGPRMAACHE